MTFYNKLTDSSNPFIIAEAGSNHNGDMELAKQLIDKAKEAGCDAVKFQSWAPDTLFSEQMFEQNKDMVAQDVDAKGLEAIQNKLALSEEDHKLLKSYCDGKGIIFCSTPFSKGQVDLLVEVGVPFLKIASLDITNHLLLKHAAKTNLPILISIGMADEDEIQQAINVMDGEGNNQVILLHCVSVYPPKDGMVNLRTIEWLKERYNVPVGYSDHTNGLTVPLASAALGASVIEKHFMLGGVHCRDEGVSLVPEQMKELVSGIRHIAASLGTKDRILSEEELGRRGAMRRSILTKTNLAAGTTLTEDNIVLKRPGTGISPSKLDEVLGRKLKTDKAIEEIIRWEDLE